MKHTLTRAALAVLSLVLASRISQAQWTQLDGPHSGPAGFVYQYNGNLYASLSSFTSAKTYRSTDNGQTWSLFNGSAPSLGISSAAGNSTALFIVSSARDLYYSTAGTGAWKLIDSGFINRNAINRLVSLNDSVYAFGSNLACYEFNVGSERWAIRDTGVSGVQQVTGVVAHGGWFIAATSGKGIMRSSDRGMTWAQSNSGLPRATGGGLVLHGNMLIFGMNTNLAVDSLFASTDDGATWSFLAQTPAHVSAQIAGDGEHLYVFSAYNGIWRSDDNASSWKAIGSDLPTLGIQSINVSSGLLAIGTSAGPFVSTDRGGHCSYMPVKQPGWFSTIQSIAPANGVVVAGTQASGAYRSFDRGASWTPTDIGFVSTNVTALTKIGSDIFCGAGNVYKTTDQGTTWKRTDTLKAGMPRTVTALATDGVRLFAASSNQGVFHSTDNGFSWTADTVGISRKSFTSLSLAGDTIFAGTTTGIFRSTDNGASWSATYSGMSDTNVLSLVTYKGIHIASTAAGIFTSVDGGSSWSSTLLFTSIRTLAVVGDSIYAGGDGMYISSDGGQSWDVDGNDLSSATISSLATDGNYLYAGTTATGVWRRPVSVSAGVGTEIRSLSNGLAAFPNPFVSSLSVEFTSPVESRATITLYDILGRQRYRVDAFSVGIGRNKAEVSLPDLLPGRYVLVVSSPGFGVLRSSVCKQ